jgi:hypothetical protein
MKVTKKMCVYYSLYNSMELCLCCNETNANRTNQNYCSSHNVRDEVNGDFHSGEDL